MITLFVVVFAGGPVLLAPATVDLFGSKDATAIYGRLWMMLPAANLLGASMVAKVSGEHLAECPALFQHSRQRF